MKRKITWMKINESHLLNHEVVYKMRTTLRLAKNTHYPFMLVHISSCTFESKFHWLFATFWLKFSWLIFHTDLSMWQAFFCLSMSFLNFETIPIKSWHCLFPGKPAETEKNIISRFPKKSKSDHCLPHPIQLQRDMPYQCFSCQCSNVLQQLVQGKDLLISSWFGS